MTRRKHEPSLPNRLTRHPALRIIFGVLILAGAVYGVVAVGAMRRSYFVPVAAAALGVYYVADAVREMRGGRGNRRRR